MAEPSPPRKGALTRKVAWASALLTTAQGLGRGLDLITLVILAQFLVPADFGLVMLATAVLTSLRLFTELPVSEALIERPALIDDEIDTAFTMSILRGVLISLGLIALAWPFAQIFDDDRLILLMIVLTASPLLSGFKSPMMVKFARAVNYVPASKIDLASRFGAFILSVGTVILFRSFWALVVSQVSVYLISTLLSYVVAPYRPRFTLVAWRQIMSFTGWVSLSRAILSLNAETDRFVIGGVLGKTALGVYGVGRSLSAAATWVVGASLLQVAFPGFRKIRDDRERLARAYQKGQGVMVAMTLPAGVGLGAVAIPFVDLFLGPEWSQTVLVIAVLAPIVALDSMIVTAQSLALAINRPREVFFRELLAFAICVPLVIVGTLLYGLVGAVFARAVSPFFKLWLNMKIVDRAVGLSPVAQIANCGRSLVSAAIMSASLWAIILSLPPLAPSPSGYASFVGLLVTGALIYTLAHYLLWRMAGRPDGPETFVLGILEGSWRRARRAMGRAT